MIREKIYRILGKEGNITIPQMMRFHIGFQPGDVVYIPHDDVSEYNVFVRKLLPTAQFLSTFTFPALNFIQ